MSNQNIQTPARSVPFTKTILSLLVFLAIGSAFPQSSPATILFADDFEAPGWNGTNAGWDEIRQGPGGVGMLSSTTNPYNGGHSLQLNWAQSSSEYGMGLFKFNLSWNEIYVRWYVFYGTGFAWPTGGNVDKKEFRTGGPPSSGEDLVFNSRSVSPTAHWALYSNPNYVAGGVPWLYMNVGSDTIISPGQWYCLELHIKKGNPVIFEGWVNDTKKWDYPNVSMGTSPINNLELAGTFNGGPPKNETQWIDDFVVSDSRIGCAAKPVDPTPPAAPKGLKIQ